MNFKEYEEKFREKARIQNKDEEFISKCLCYAQKLYNKNIPIIYDIGHFSLLVGVKVPFLLAITNSQKNFYRTFSVPKHSGKMRKIDEPLPLLKEIQTYILKNILEKVPCSIYSKAYKKGYSIKENAKFHRNQKVLIKMDIEDYFPSLSEAKVYGFFKDTLGYTVAVSVMLTKLCTLNDGLPQGAPTSPYLSNLLTVDLDNSIYDYCTNNGKLRYTRYADDIFISGDIEAAQPIIKTINKILYSNGLRPNKEKTAVIKNSAQQCVTGIVVNKKIQTPKSYRKEIRAEIYYWNRYGIDEHFNRIKHNFQEYDKKTYCQHLLGKINFCLQVNPRDAEMKKYREFVLKQMRNM